MPKLIDYPRASLKSCLELAIAVEDLGGECTIEMAAERLNKRPSGAFSALVASAGRFGLVDGNKGLLATTELFRNHKLAYTEDEARRYLATAFLNSAVFSNIYGRFVGREIPLGHFEKLLIREFGVPQNVSSRVVKYFIEGAKQCGLLDSNNILSDNREAVTSLNGEDNEDNGDEAESKPSEHVASQYNQEKESHVHERLTLESEGLYSIRIKGPGMDSVMIINEQDDLLIVQAMLKKVENKLAAAKAESRTQLPKEIVGE